MKGNDRNREHGADRKDDDSGGSANSCRERGRKCRSALAAVEENSQRPRQNDADKWDRANENAEHAGLERSTNGGSSIYRISGQNGPVRIRGLCNPWGKFFLHGSRCGGNYGIWNRDLDINLRSAALRTKRTPILYRGSASLAKVFHLFEASAQPSRRARSSGHLASRRLETLASKITRSRDSPVLFKWCRPSRCACANRPGQSGFPGCCA